MKNSFENRSIENDFSEYAAYNMLKKSNGSNCGGGGMSNGKAVLLTIISFVIAAVITGNLGLDDTPFVIVFIIFWGVIGALLACFHDRIEFFK